MKLAISLVMAVLIGLSFTPVWAQEADESAGVQNQVRWVAPQEFQRMDEEAYDDDWGYESDLELYDDGDDWEARWRAQINLPDGARIVSAKWYLYDNCGDDPDENSIDVWIGKVVPSCVGPTQFNRICYAETFTDSGYTCLDCDFDVPGQRTIRNNNGYYVAALEFDTDDCSDRQQRFSGLKIVYRLQVSPAPTTATFNDVPVGSQWHQYVEALADSGITSGCGGGNYCPDHPVTRGQMSKFLAKGFGLYWAP